MMNAFFFEQRALLPPRVIMMTRGRVTVLSCLALLFIMGRVDPASAVSLILDHDVYEVGAVVEFTIHNPHGEPILIPHEPPYCTQYLDENITIFCGNLPSIFELDPGESAVFHWDTAWRPDLPGEYRIVVDWYLGSEQEITTADYSLVPSIGSEASSWSAIKSMYR